MTIGATPAKTGISLAYQLDGAEGPTRLDLRIEGTNARVEVVSGEEHMTLLADTARKRSIMLDHQSRAFDEFTPEQFEQVRTARQVAIETNRARARDPSLTDLERVTLQAMLDRAEHPPQPQFIRIKGSREIAGCHCEKYEIRLEGRAVADACLIPWADLGFDRAQLEPGLQSARDASPLPQPFRLSRGGAAAGSPRLAARPVRPEGPSLRSDAGPGIERPHPPHHVRAAG
jgi:hypothetical protein